MKNIELLMNECLSIINDVDGYKSEYFRVQCFSALRQFHDELRDRPDLQQIRQHFFDACSILDTSFLHYRMRHKPLGYAGDYLLIDWMYTQKAKTAGPGHHWDIMFHQYPGSVAVRNRKDMCWKVLADVASDATSPVNVLDAGCGSCRDMYEAMDNLSGGEKQVAVCHFIDLDQEALRYAEQLKAEHQLQAEMQWQCSNILRLKPQMQYDLIWSAGLFDYFNDRLVVFLLKRMWGWLAPNGRIVFGNFHPRNPTRIAMELCGQWFLIHRTEDDLMKLVKAAGIPEANATVHSESLGINLFCEIYK